jgi:hypothetical protein
MERGILEIKNRGLSVIETATKKVEFCCDITAQLRKLYFLSPPDTPENQIHFFKHVKPKFFSRLFYQRHILKYYRSMPKGDIKAKKLHISAHLSDASSIISLQSDFHNYIALMLDDLDSMYFTNRKYCPKLHGQFELPLDPDFSSPADETLSRLLAAEQYIDFLHREEQRLKNPSLDPSWEFMKSLEWQGTKTDLVELIYALHSSGTLKGDLKDIISVMERSFNVDLGYFYRLYTDIKLKRNPTSFIDSLKISLLAKIRSEN